MIKENSTETMEQVPLDFAALMAGIDQEKKRQNGNPANNFKEEYPDIKSRGVKVAVKLPTALSDPEMLVQRI